MNMNSCKIDEENTCTADYCSATQNHVTQSFCHSTPRCRLGIISAHLTTGCKDTVSDKSTVQDAIPQHPQTPHDPSYLGPLHGLRVLDLTQMVSGPMGTQILADMGADVIKIEGLNGAAERGSSKANITSSLFSLTARNKRSLCIDLKHPDGKDMFLKLIPRADVVVQNFRPGVMEKMGIGYETLSAINPQLYGGMNYVTLLPLNLTRIYMSISGFGSSGPYSDKRVYDPIIQGASGLASIQADASGRPQMMRLIVPDKVTALTSAQAITAAVVQRYRTGKGTRIDLSMLDAVIAFAWGEAFAQLGFVGGQDPNFEYTRDMVYQTKDGWITCGAVQPKEWEGLCRALSKPEWMDDERFNTQQKRSLNRSVRYEVTEEVLKTMTTQEAIARLDANDVPNGVVHHPRTRVLADPQVITNGLISTATHPWAPLPLRQPRPAAQFDTAPYCLRRHAPLLGEHTRDVLADTGATPEQLDALIAAGVVRHTHGKPVVEQHGRDPRLRTLMSA